MFEAKHCIVYMHPCKFKWTQTAINVCMPLAMSLHVLFHRHRRQIMASNTLIEFVATENFMVREVFIALAATEELFETESMKQSEQK